MSSCGSAWQTGCAGGYLGHDPARRKIGGCADPGVCTGVLRVVDDSARHAGHAGAQPGGETHYSVLVVAEAFRGMTRVARSRAVHAALAAEFSGGMHALALTLRTPEEQGPVG